MSKILVDQLEALDAGVVKDVASLVDDFNAELAGAVVTTSTGTQTLVAALDDALRLRTYVAPEDFGAVGDGIQDDRQALLDASLSGKTVLSKPGSTYRISSPLTISNDHWFFNGSSVILDFDQDSSSYGLSLLGRTVDDVRVTIPTGRVIDRAVRCTIGSRFVGSIRVVGTDQQPTTGINSAGVTLAANGVECRSVYVENYDNGVIVSGDGVYTEDIEVVSYKRGVWCSGADNWRFGKIHTHTSAPGATMQPGHNGVLFSGPTNGMYGEQIYVEDSGEHGVRWGGSGGAGPGTHWNFYIGNITTRNTGGCGVKFRTNDADRTRNGQISSIFVEDCGDPSNPITNQEGLLLERVVGVQIGMYKCTKRNKAYSCHNGVAVTNCNNVDIFSWDISDTNREGFFFDTSDNDDLGDPIFNSIDDFYVGPGILRNPGRHAIYLLLDTEVVRHIVFKGMYCRGLDGSNAALLISTVNGGFVNPNSSFEIEFTRSSSTSEPVRGNGLNANVFLQVIGNDAPLSTMAKPGSSWWNTSSGIRFVRSTSTGNWTDVLA